MSGKRLLVIEDDPDIATLISRIATDMDFQVTTTYGMAVPQAYRETKPDIIVLDIMMPEMDGLEVLQFLRHEGSEARLIILSGSQESYRRIAQNIGLSAGLRIEANVSKPFRAADLRLVLEKASRTLSTQEQQIASVRV